MSISTPSSLVILVANGINSDASEKSTSPFSMRMFLIAKSNSPSFFCCFAASVGFSFLEAVCFASAFCVLLLPLFFTRRLRLNSRSLFRCVFKNGALRVTRSKFKKFFANEILDSLRFLKAKTLSPEPSASSIFAMFALPLTEASAAYFTLSSAFSSPLFRLASR